MPKTCDTHNDIIKAINDMAGRKANLSTVITILGIIVTLALSVNGFQIHQNQQQLELVRSVVTIQQQILITSAVTKEQIAALEVISDECTTGMAAVKKHVLLDELKWGSNAAEAGETRNDTN